MQFLKIFAAVLLSVPALCAAAPQLKPINAAMEEMIEKDEIAGAVTVVVSKNKVLHLGTTGFADVEAKRPMEEDTIFWIASMTKPVTAVAVMMLFDEGKLKPTDLVSKYSGICRFENTLRKTGEPHNHSHPHAYFRTRGSIWRGGAQSKDVEISRSILGGETNGIRAGRKVGLLPKRNQRGRPHRGSRQWDDFRRVFAETLV